MQAKNKVKALFTIFVICLIILCTAFLLRFIFKYNKPLHKIDKENASLHILDVENFASEDFPFRFSIITFSFKTNFKSTYNLTNLITEEGIRVSDAEKYLAQLKEKSLSLINVNLVNSLTSNADECVGKAFVAYRKQSGFLEIKDINSRYIFKIDLDKKVNTFSVFKPKTGALVEENNYILKVSDSYICERVNYLDEEYLYPSSVNIFAYIVEVKEANNKDFVVEDAIFKPLNSQEKFKALGKDYYDIRRDKQSILSRNLKKGDSGVLLFEIYDPNEEKIERNGTLYLKIKNQEKLLELSTKLN